MRELDQKHRSWMDNVNHSTTRLSQTSLKSSDRGPNVTFWCRSLSVRHLSRDSLQPGIILIPIVKILCTSTKMTSINVSD